MSSSEIAISARGLGKSYVIEHKERESTAAETLLKYLANPFRRPEKEVVWSLRDVSFDINRGEIVGVVGRNGAGKSTLLKVLSRITAPTTGEAHITGRVGSLIEVGTGFQPELTGRENIYLNGAILGMRRREITRRFDEIVDFSGVERFLDTPVKRYSSGMYVRLAFAVAATLDTEILLVDEVLSVGDAEFQRKSLGKMGDVARSGRTVLFVSHNMATLEALCTSALLFHSGQLIKSGGVPEIIADYHRMSLQARKGGGASNEVAPIEFGDRFTYFRSADLVDEAGRSTRSISTGGRFSLEVEVEADAAFDYPTFVVYIDSIFGNNILTVKSPNTAAAIPKLEGRCRLNCTIDSLPIVPGDYTISVALWKSGAQLEDIETDIQFTVRNADVFGDGWGAAKSGVCIAKSEWSLTEPMARNLLAI